MFFIFAIFLLFKIKKSFICRFLLKIFDFLLYTSLGDLYILNPPKVSMHLGTKIKGLPIAKAMWKEVKEDATSKSTLYLLDAEDQLASMKLADNDNPKTHLEELKQHFQTMLQCRDNLLKIGSIMSNSRFNIIIMSSLPESYRPTL